VRSRSLALTLALLSSSAGLFALACLGDDVTSEGPPAETITPDAGTGESPRPTADSGEADAGPTTFCTTVPRPTAGEFFCADFDGEDFLAGLARTSDGGRVERVTALVASPPASLATDATALRWDSVGGARITQVDLRVRFYLGTIEGIVPPTPGSVTLLRLGTLEGNEVALRYTFGGTVNGASYFGFYLFGKSCPNVCNPDVFTTFTGSPNAKEWNELQLRWASDGTTSLSINGIDRLPSGYKLVPLASTTLRAEVGVQPNVPGQPTTLARTGFDDLRIQVVR